MTQPRDGAMRAADGQGPATPLEGTRVLIVEDEAFIALDLAAAVLDAGGEVVGPAARVAEALVLATGDGLGAALLDVDLPDGHVGPVLEALVARGIPVVVHTGVGLPPALAARFPEVPVCLKPTPAETLVGLLAAAIAK